jgi:HEAT repeat protein
MAMNCNDVQKILNGATSSTDASEHARVRTHLTACAECKEEWDAQQLLAALPVAPASSRLVDLARDALELPPAPARQAGRRVSTIVVGTLLVAAAAASVIIGTRSGPGNNEPLAAEDSSTRAVPVLSPPPEPRESASPIASARVDLRQAGRETGAADLPINLDRSWVAVLPLPQGAASEEVMAVVEERRAEIARRIAETDGLHLVDESVVRDYVAAGMTDTEIARTLGAGVVIFPQIDRHDGAVRIRFSKLDPATDRLIAGTELMHVDDEARAAGVDPARFTQRNALIWDNNLAVILGVIVREAYPQLTQSDDQLAAQNRAALLDTNLDREARLEALEHFRGRPIDRVIIDGAAALLEGAADPQMRRRILFALRAADDPNLVQVLLRTLAYDSSADVRLDAARMLARFSGETAVRDALEAAEVNDTAAAVREAAAVAKLSQDRRLELRRETFLNRALPAMTRMMELNIGFVDSTKGPALPVDDAIGRELVDIAVNGASDDDRGMALTILYYIPSSFPAAALSPELREPLLAMLNDDPDPSMRGAAAAALRLFVDQRDVREALEHARDNDPVRQIRNSANRALESAP